MPLNNALGNATSVEPDQTIGSALFAETYLPHIVKNLKSWDREKNYSSCPKIGQFAFFRVQACV